MQTKYAIHIFWSEEDQGFIAICDEFSGLSAFGGSREEALKETQTALDGMIEAYRSKGLRMPDPVRFPIAA